MKMISGKLVLALLLPALSIYCLMIFVTLAHLSALAGGQRVFDMMPAGYGLTYAGGLLESLGEEITQPVVWKFGSGVITHPGIPI
jgi:hypothetical protein